MTMSEGTAATTLSATSSGAGYARASIGNARGSISGHSRRDSLGATSTGSGGAARPPARSSLSRTESAGSKTAMARMEQRGGGAGSVASATGSSHTGSDADLRHSHYKEGIRLAEMGDWPVLVRRLPREPQLARHKDHHGMLPLHWACTEDDAGPAVVEALLAAFPEGVLTRNNAQYLPIHIAVRAGLPNDTLQLLCDARPSSLLEETPAGKTPLMLAIEASLPASTVNLLRRAQQNYEDPSEDNDDDRNIEDTKRAIEVQSHLLRESMMLGNSFVGARSNNPTASNQHSSLTVGRLQSNSVLGAFPSEARSSVAWADRRVTSSVSNQSFAATTNTNLSSTRSLPAVPSTSSVSSSSSVNASNNNAVVRYMDTLMRDKPSDYMIDEEHELMGRYTTDEEHLPPRSFLAHPGSQSMGGFPLSNPTSGATAPRPTHLRATEGDLSGFNSGVCGVCYKKFSMFRKKYQCKSCWMVVCKKHVAAKIELPGHKKKRSVCADCNILHSDGGNVLPSVPGHGSVAGGGPAFAHTHPGTYSVIGSSNPSSSAIVPTRGHRADSTPYKSSNHMGGGAVRQSALSNASDLRHTVAAAPSRPSGSVRFAPAPAPPSNATTNANANGNANSMALVQKPPPSQRGALDRFGSDTTASLTDTDRNSAEVTAMSHRIATLEEQNKMLLSRLADQEKQYDDCMLLLTQTMTRVAEIEMRVPGLRLNANGSERESDAELNPASFDFGYPMSGAYGSYAIK